VRVKFLVDAVAKAGNVKGECDEGAAPKKFKAGQIVDMPETSARHWINRRKAEVYVEEPKPAAKPVVASGKKED
jgi:hypothetical protein